MQCDFYAAHFLHLKSLDVVTSEKHELQGVQLVLQMLRSFYRLTYIYYKYVESAACYLQASKATETASTQSQEQVTVDLSNSAVMDLLASTSGIRSFKLNPFDC